MPSSPSSAERAGAGRRPATAGTSSSRRGDGRRILCHSRGKKSTLVVGDLVRWSADRRRRRRRGDAAARATCCYRQDEWKTKAFAANIDQLLVVVAAEPVFSESQLARALIAANDAGIDGAHRPQQARPAELRRGARPASRRTRAMGVDVVARGAEEGTRRCACGLAPCSKAEATLVLGPSGAGKSTLVNLMVADAEAQVGEISQALNSGRHTTTATHWYWLDDARARRRSIDSPGFQEFGLRHIAADAAADPDARHRPRTPRNAASTTARHLHEPGCGVLAALRARRASRASRYRIYPEIRAELAA